MSSLDPFGGPARPISGYKSRSKTGDMGSILRQVDETVRDVGSQLTGRSVRGWSGFGGALGMVDVAFGIIFLLLAFKVGDAVLFGTALATGIGMVLLGGVGVIAVKRDAPSIKTLHLTMAVVVGLLGSSYTNQVLFTSRSDCILAETYMRLDHLETAMHNVRHEELINGIMMRLDHLSTDIDHIREHADDKVEETRKQSEFKQMDVKYVDEKLRDLMNIAEEGIAALDRQVAELEYNISKLEDQRDDDADSKSSKTQLKAKLRSLRYRQKTLGPRRTALREVTQRLEGHMEGGISTDDYVDILSMLEKQINDKDLQEELKGERDEVAYVRASTKRLERDVYDNMIVGDYHERMRNRTATREKQRKKYEKFMSNIYKRHDNKVGNKERYLHSLNNWLETMPEHCMEDLDNMWLSTTLGGAAISLAGITGYVALTTTVMSAKKDF